jgi:RimJ/RimL family protein N-acetyltransferase
MTHDLTTPRLKLRHLRAADASRLQSLCDNLNVARMLEVVPHPYPDGLAEDWIAARPAGWRDGTNYTFAIEFEAELIGVIAIERREDGTHALGYWLGEPWWGRGLMSEAVACTIGFARDRLGLKKLVSAYFTENAASGRIQEKHGFLVVGHGRLSSTARECEVDATFTELNLSEAC